MDYIFIGHQIEKERDTHNSMINIFQVTNCGHIRNAILFCGTYSSNINFLWPTFWVFPVFRKRCLHSQNSSSPGWIPSYAETQWIHASPSIFNYETTFPIRIQSQQQQNLHFMQHIIRQTVWVEFSAASYLLPSQHLIDNLNHLRNSV